MVTRRDFFKVGAAAATATAALGGAKALTAQKTPAIRGG